MRPSSTGVAQLMMWRMPLGYSMSSRRQNGKYQLLRIRRSVSSSVLPVTWCATGGLRMSMTVVAWKP